MVTGLLKPQYTQYLTKYLRKVINIEAKLVTWQVESIPNITNPFKCMSAPSWHSMVHTTYIIIIIIIILA